MPTEHTERNAVALLESILLSCQERHRPLQEEPARSEIFEIFARSMAPSQPWPTLAADEICRDLAERWGLKGALQNSVTQQAGVPASELAKMRSLWTLLQMWMEWTYAWERWPEFHKTGQASSREEA